MKKLALFAMLAAGASSGVPKLAASLGYGDVSVQDSLKSLQVALDSVTKVFGH